MITNIDVQSIEPVDHHMRDSLMKSVQMAIEISTKWAAIMSQNPPSTHHLIEPVYTTTDCQCVLFSLWLLQKLQFQFKSPFSWSYKQFLLSHVHRSIERAAQHEAERTERKAKGELERQKLINEKVVEEARHTLLELQAVAAAVESSGQAKAEAQAQAEKLLIEGQSAIECEF